MTEGVVHVPDLNLGELDVACDSWPDGGSIPVEHTADGAGRPPVVRWTGVPAGAVELVLVMHDPDAPLVDGFTHWAVHGIDPNVGSIGEGNDASTAGGVVEDLNELGETGYAGPDPPPGHGVHHYFLHLYALDRPIGGDAPLSPAELHERMVGHVLEQARWTGTYGR